MQNMFQSATLKLTAWYLIIIMIVSVTFSIVIYQLNYREVSYRLENLQHSIIDEFNAPAPFNTYFNDEKEGPNSLIFNESHKASNQMILSLVYINIVVFITGGLGSYILARRTLRPIAEAHEAQSRFTSDASHELRTPLAAMKTELEVNLRDPKLEIGEARELLVSNLEEVNKLIQLSEMLLRLSRLEHEKLEVDTVDLPVILDEILKRYPNDKKRFDVTTRKKATTLANEPAVSELMGILIDNAIKYSPEKSPIFIRVFEKRGQVGFEIKNSGKPIPEEKLPKLFDRFYRADTSRTSGSKKGYGLGLSIAKKIIDVHHGELTVSSDDDATTFTFYLQIVRKSSVKPQN
ncbi:MAG: sensor histidine kinase [Candidatus Saccharimonadaceae bacterium]